MIAIKYLFGFLPIDVLCCIPFSLFTSNTYGTVKILRLFKLPYLMNMIKRTNVKKIEEAVKKPAFRIFYKVYITLFQLIYVILTTLIIMHLVSCLWCAIGKFEADLSRLITQFH